MSEFILIDEEGTCLGFPEDNDDHEHIDYSIDHGHLHSNKRPIYLFPHDADAIVSGQFIKKWEEK